METPRIVIIEKDHFLAHFMSGKLSDLGTVVVHTKDDTTGSMPPQDEILADIKTANVILLDPYADRSYDTAALALCAVEATEKPAKVIFIPELYDKDLSIFSRHDLSQKIKIWRAKGAFRTALAETLGTKHDVMGYIFSLRKSIFTLLDLVPSNFGFREKEV